MRCNKRGGDPRRAPIISVQYQQFPISPSRISYVIPNCLHDRQNGLHNTLARGKKMNNLTYITLDELKIGQRAEIRKVGAAGAMRRRLRDIGIIEGTVVECLQKGPSGDPAAFSIRGSTFAIRNMDSRDIAVRLVV